MLEGDYSCGKRMCGPELPAEVFGLGKTIMGDDDEADGLDDTHRKDEMRGKFLIQVHTVHCPNQ